MMYPETSFCKRHERVYFTTSGCDKCASETTSALQLRLADVERERDEALAREAGLRIQLQDRIEAVEHLSGDRNRWKSIADALRTDLRTERKRADEAIRSKRTTHERLTNLHAAAQQEVARLRKALKDSQRHPELEPGGAGPTGLPRSAGTATSGVSLSPDVVGAGATGDDAES